MPLPSPLVYEAGTACETGKTSGWDGVAATTRLASPETEDDEAAAAAAGRRCRPPTGSARPWYRTPGYFTEGWTDGAIWRAGVIEAVGTFCLTWLAGQFGVALGNLEGPGPGPASPGHVGVWLVAMLTPLVAATAPGSGGHLNPMITAAAVLCGLCPLARGAAYLAAQGLGAAAAGALLRAAWGRDRALAYQGGGCFYDPTTMATSQVMAVETVSSFILLFLVFGVGFHPRQAAVFGPRLVPALVGVSFGAVTFVSHGLVDGYAGANMNPARCFAVSVATGEFSAQWIFWVAGLVGAVFQAALYNFNPPW